MGLFDTKADREAQRARENLDDAFTQEFLYFFELRVGYTYAGPSYHADPGLAGDALQQGGTPASGDVTRTSLSGAGGSTYLFPLCLAPEAISVSDPFTYALTPTNEGGLFVEENGIVQRAIHVAGHMGFAPKAWTGDFHFGPGTRSRSFTFRPERIPLAFREISGQKHFEFIQDMVFRTYGDLKRDPTTARGATLIWHNPRDNEHWVVIPAELTSQRDRARPVMYPYTFDLIVVDKADAVLAPGEQARDRSWLETLIDGGRRVISAVQDLRDRIRGALNTIRSIVNSVTSLVSGLINTISTIAGIVSDLTDFLTGVATSIATPFKTVAKVAQDIQNTITQVDALFPHGSSNGAIGDMLESEFDRAKLAINELALHPSLFKDNSRPAPPQIDASQTPTSRASLQALAANPPTTAQQLADSGSAPVIGDADFDPSRIDVDPTPPTFRSAATRVVGVGDSLESLATQYLGSPQFAPILADVNRLSAPYISAAGLPGTLRPGDPILVPSTAPLPADIALPATVGSSPLGPLAERLYGVDFLIERDDETGLYDFVIDPASGGTDTLLVRGAPNLVQGISSRLEIELGTYMLYPNVGFERIVGTRFPVVNDAMLQLRLRSALVPDQRIQSIDAIRTRTARTDPTVSADTVYAEVEATGIGLLQPVQASAQPA